MDKILLLILASLLTTSCSKGDKRLEEKADIQAQRDIQAININNNEIVTKLENDLNKRKHFIRSIEGEFEGKLTVDDTGYLMRIKITPTSPIEETHQNRTIDQVNYELQNLGLNINIKQWNPMVPLSAVTCTVQNYRPDIKQGLINIISEKCKNLYEFYISDNSIDIETSKVDIKKDSELLAIKISSQSISRIEYLLGVFESAVGSKSYRLSLGRK
jgi:hypothetical protein